MNGTYLMKLNNASVKTLAILTILLPGSLKMTAFLWMSRISHCKAVILLIQRKTKIIQQHLEIVYIFLFTNSQKLCIYILIHQHLEIFYILLFTNSQKLSYFLFTSSKKCLHFLIQQHFEIFYTLLFSNRNFLPFR